jgi:AmiR/NasT family two-component response regulator
MRQGASAHLRKPVGSGGVFSALMIARRTFEAQRALEGEVAELRSRLARRSAVARALVLLMTSEKIDEAAALQQLREIAMSARQSIEDAADALIAHKENTDDSRNRA